MADHPDTPYPPPTYIDFAAGDLRRPRFPPTRLSPLNFHCQWLGARHDGYPLATTLKKYTLLRVESALDIRGRAALMQSALTFGLLEAVLRIKIPETFLLAQAADGTTTLSTANLLTLFRDLYHRLRVRHHPANGRSWRGDVAVTLSEAYRRLEAYRRDRSTNPFLAAGLREEASEDILRASCMIGNSLEDMLRGLPSECEPDQTLSSLHFYQVPDKEPAQDQLRARGWCPLTGFGRGLLRLGVDKPLDESEKQSSACKLALLFS